jgi:hypothetical protein
VSPRHLRAVPDPEPGRERDPWAELLETLLRIPGGVYERLEHQRVTGWWQRTAPAPAPGRRPATIGPPRPDPPGWWVCPTCGHRVDRGTKARTVTARHCAGGRRGEPVHPLAAMVVRR